jgi:hypothetical protein
VDRYRHMHALIQLSLPHACTHANTPSKLHRTCCEAHGQLFGRISSKMMKMVSIINNANCFEDKKKQTKTETIINNAIHLGKVYNSSKHQHTYLQHPLVDVDIEEEHPVT